MVVIDHDLWQNRLGGRADIVGTTITLNRVPHIVVGVTPQRFRGQSGRRTLRTFSSGCRSTSTRA